MSSLKIISFSVLLLMAVASLCSGEFRVARQASRCNAGTSCIAMTSCPSIQKLMRNPTRHNLLRVRQALCDNIRGSLKVCCETIRTTSAATTTTTTIPSSDGRSVLPKRCGLSTSGSRVFFGEVAPLGAHPWMAVLGYRTGISGQLEWKCGGSLINERYVLTAAHCVIPSLPLEEVRLGEHNLDSVPDCTEGGRSRTCAPRHQSFKITSRSQIISHPNFNTRTPASDDIALIRLDRKVTLNAFVHPICLPDTKFNPKSFLGSEEGIVAGWGRTEEGRDSNVLKRAKIPLVDLEKCQPIYAYRLNNDQICFGGAAKRDSCNGDSGGPVFQSNARGINYVIGIVSFGRNCGESPAIYTNVASYRSWIVRNMRP